MTWLASKLRHRAQIREATQTPNDAGGFTRTYKLIAKVWVDLKPMSERFLQNMYIRGKQTADVPTHIVTMRRNPSLGADFMGNNPKVGSDYFLYVKTNEQDGRLFRMERITNVNERGEYLTIWVMEMEQQQGEGFLNG